jgi:hypothetical protein
MKKKIISISTAIIIIIASLFVYNAVIPKSYIKISVAPQDVKITLNNNVRSVKNGDTITVNPGEYKITISQDNFESYSTTITVGNHQTSELLAALKPQNDTANNLLLNNDSQTVMQQFYGKSADTQTDTIKKSFPIIDILPIQARLYTISACQSKKYPNDTTKLALCAEESQPGLDPYILKDISSRGFNPSDYEIIFIDQYSAD